MAVTETRKSLDQQIAALATRWVQVGTNQGTYGAIEACQAVGCGSPEFADCNIYEQVGTGERRAEGCDPDRAPGRIRRSNAELSDCQRQLAELQKKAKGSH
jgi:hypothetical protein